MRFKFNNITNYHNIISGELYGIRVWPEYTNLIKIEWK